MNLLVFKASSRNAVTTRMAISLASALSSLGENASLFAPEGADGPARLARAVAKGTVDHVISFGSFAADLAGEDGRSLYDTLGCGFVGWDVDHPVYQFDRFARPMGRRVQVCASRSHFDAARAMGCKAGTLVMLPGVDAVADDPLPIEERPIPCAVAMSWLGEPQVWWNGVKGTPAFALIEGVVERVLADPEADLARAYAETLADTGFEIAFDRSIAAILANIGLFVRQYDRLGVAKALAAMDVPCTLIGAGWRERLGERAHLTFLDDLDFDAMSAVHGRSKVVLNLNAANGASERAIGAMAAGAVAVSDESPLLRTEFESRDALRFFDRRHPAALCGLLSSIVEGPEAQGLADRGRARVAEAHLWRHKAATIADVLRRSSPADRAA